MRQFHIELFLLKLLPLVMEMLVAAFDAHLGRTSSPKTRMRNRFERGWVNRTEKQNSLGEGEWRLSDQSASPVWQPCSRHTCSNNKLLLRTVTPVHLRSLRSPRTCRGEGPQPWLTAGLSESITTRSQAFYAWSGRSSLWTRTGRGFMWLVRYGSCWVGLGESYWFA